MKIAHFRGDATDILAFNKTTGACSFADYMNANNMNFGALRVLNDDLVKPANGFGCGLHTMYTSAVLLF